MSKNVLTHNFFIDNPLSLLYLIKKEKQIMSQSKINCCETCQIYWTCETKWYRGEKGEENVCCPVCNYFLVCGEKAKKEKDAKK